jgi:hypothetical protein
MRLLRWLGLVEYSPLCVKHVQHSSVCDSLEWTSATKSGEGRFGEDEVWLDPAREYTLELDHFSTSQV